MISKDHSNFPSSTSALAFFAAVYSLTPLSIILPIKSTSLANNSRLFLESINESINISSILLKPDFPEPSIPRLNKIVGNSPITRPIQQIQQFSNYRVQVFLQYISK